MGLPEHMTPAEVAALLRWDVRDVLQQVERGAIRCEAAGIPASEVAALGLLEGFKHDAELELVEGSTASPSRSGRARAAVRPVGSSTWARRSWMARSSITTSSTPS